MRLPLLLAFAVSATSLLSQVETAPVSRPKAPTIPADTEVKTTASGLKYSVLKAGKPGGKSPTANVKVRVYQRGWVSDGTLFAASWSPDPPFQIGLNYMIDGWSEGVQLMTPGARFKLTVPPQLGFGERGTKIIPPNSTLIFEIELIDFEEGPKPLPAPDFAPIDESKLKTTATGLKYRVLKEGSGPRPKIGQTVTTNHALWLSNGTLVFSSYVLGHSETFPVGGPAVAGWTEGIQLMKEGSTYELVIPPELGYGSQDSKKIPANSTLVWHIELVKVE